MNEKAKAEAIQRILARRDARLAREAEEAKAQAVVTAPVSKKFAETVRANPDSVRLTARDADGVTHVERPTAMAAGEVRVRADLVWRVDRAGRPIWDVPETMSSYDPFGNAGTMDELVRQQEERHRR